MFRNHNLYHIDSSLQSTMRPFQHLLALSALSVASPLPLNEDASANGLRLLGIDHLGTANMQSASEAHLALQTLEKRLNRQQCKAIGRQLLKIGTSAAVYVIFRPASFVNENLILTQHL